MNSNEAVDELQEWTLSALREGCSVVLTPEVAQTIVTGYRQMQSRLEHLTRIMQGTRNELQRRVGILASETDYTAVLLRKLDGE